MNPYTSIPKVFSSALSGYKESLNKPHVELLLNAIWESDNFMYLQHTLTFKRDGSCEVVIEHIDNKRQYLVNVQPLNKRGA